MPANYLHGVETIQIFKGARPVNVIKTAVVGIVGIAPQGPTQELVLVQTEQDAAQFGVLHPDNTIRMALDKILDQGGALCVVVNVFDDAAHVDAHTESATVTNNRVRLSKLFYDNLVVKKGIITLTVDVDYTYDPDTQIVNVINVGAYPDGSVLDLEYDFVDSSTVVASEVVGSVVGNVRTGMQLFDLSFSAFGFSPKILICPTMSDNQTVAGEMLSKANLYRAMALLDAPSDALPSEVIAGRGTTTGTVKNFFTSSKRAILLYPYTIISNPYSGAEMEYPLSPFFAGIMAQTDQNRGYWVSPSNKEVLGFLRPRHILTAAVNNANTQVNLLNEKGVVTIFQSFGTGYRTWGNRSAAFPTVTTPDNFIPIQRTADTVHESLEQAMLQFIDEPLNQATIDAIRETGNSFLRTLIQRGAIVDGEVKYIPANNPPTELANGHVTFDIEFMPPPPAERITFQSFINIALLQALQ